MDAVIDGSDFTSMNFGPGGESLSAKESLDLGIRFWLNSIQIKFIKNQIEVRMERHSLHFVPSEVKQLLRRQSY